VPAGKAGVPYYMPKRATLSATPAETLVAEPTYIGTPQYGAIEIGDGTDHTITLVVDEAVDAAGKGERRIYIDANNDEDLTNDGNGAWTQVTDGVVSTQATLTVEYAADGEDTAVQFPVSLYRFTTRLQDCVLYYRGAVRVGYARIGGTPVKVMLIDDSCRGLYGEHRGDPVTGAPGLGFVVDRNQDGKLEADTGSAEFYRGAEPFDFGGKGYRISRVSPMGDRVFFYPTAAEFVPKAYIGAGLPAVDFEAIDTAGKAFKLSDYKGKVVLLDFWASWCAPCRAEMPNVIAAYKAYHDKGFEIVGISLDQTLDAMNTYLSENPGITWRMVCDEKYWEAAVAQLYRVRGIPAAFLIDKEGTIYDEVRGESLTAGLEKLLGE